MESSTMVLQSVPSNDSMDLSESSTFSQDNNDPNDPSLTLTSPSLEHKSNGNGNGIRSPTDVRSFRHEHQHGHHDQEGDRDRDHDHEYDRMDSLDLDQSLARLGDLPIVREGSILDEEDDNKILMNASDSSDEDSGGDDDEDSDDTDYRGNVNANGYHNNNHNHHNGSDNHMREREYDDEVQQQYLEYQKEQEELHKEMNLNKVAFAAYRTAVLHLVHNQSSFPKNSFNRKNRTLTDDSDDYDDNNNEDEKDSLEDMTSGSVETYDEYGSTFDDNSNDNDTTNTEDEANQRMKMLEEIAKEIVETKARACFEAVIVAQDFVERRDEKRQRRSMLLGGLAGVGGQDNILAELRKMKDMKKNKKAVGKTLVKTEVSVKKTEVKAKVEDKPKVKPTVKKTVTKPSPKVTTHSTKKSTPSGPIVRLKKTSRHPDCIKDTLPKFEYKKETDENDGPDNGVSKPATYRTTSWIQNMVKWRIERNEHEEANLTKCGCPDCLVDLKKMYDKKDASSSLYSVKSLLK